MKKSFEKEIVDGKGNESIVHIQVDNIPNTINKNYKLVHETNKHKKRGVLTSDIGVHSSGFAGIMGLAMILVVAAIIIAFLMFRL